MAMTDGVFHSVATVAAILAAILVLAVLSSLVYLRTGEVSERRSLALFWGGPGGDVAAGRHSRGGDTVDYTVDSVGG